MMHPPTHAGGWSLARVWQPIDHLLRHPKFPENFSKPPVVLFFNSRLQLKALLLNLDPGVREACGIVSARHRLGKTSLSLPWQESSFSQDAPRQAEGEHHKGGSFLSPDTLLALQYQLLKDRGFFGESTMVHWRTHSTLH